MFRVYVSGFRFQVSDSVYRASGRELQVAGLDLFQEVIDAWLVGRKVFFNHHILVRSSREEKIALRGTDPDSNIN